MATATKSSLNKKLPVMDKIAFCSSAGVDMATKIFTGENGVFSCKVGFKQTNKSYPFQVQYRQRSRYTEENAQIVGASFTNWSDWKCAIAITNVVPADGTEEDYPVDRWLNANQGVNKKATYITCYEFSNYLIPSDYDAREFQFRIRAFNKSQAKHGNWATETLTVYKRADIQDETPITKTDGGMVIKFNYIWDKTASINVNSIKDASGRELVKKPFTTRIEYATLDSGTLPEARTGYTGGKINIPLGNLKRRIEVAEVLSGDIEFKTVDGAITKMELGEVQEPHRDIELSMSYTWDEELGLLKVSVINVDEVEIIELGCNITYIYHNKVYALPPIAEEIDLEDTSFFWFYPPIGIPFDIHAKAEDEDNIKDDTDILNASVSARGYRMNKADSLTIGAVAWGNPELEVKSQRQMESALPYGREKNIVFYGLGDTTEIGFSAVIVDKANLYGGELSRKEMWDTVRNNQGVYFFRTSKGEMYKVGLREISIVNDGNNMYLLNVDMVEVV